MKRSRLHITGALIATVVVLMMIVPESHGEREGFLKAITEGMQMFGKFNALRRKIRNTIDSIKEKIKAFMQKIKDTVTGTFHKVTHML